MNRKDIINRLDRATDKAALLAIRRSLPIRRGNTGMWTGNTFIKRNNNGFYDIFGLNKIKIFSDIYTIDIAVTIAQKYTSGESRTIEKIIALETKYSKYHTDMVHYLHCMKAAKVQRDFDVLAILEDKFQLTEIKAKSIKNDILIFNKIK